METRAVCLLLGLPGSLMADPAIAFVIIIDAVGHKRPSGQLRRYSGNFAHCAILSFRPDFPTEANSRLRTASAEADGIMRILRIIKVLSAAGLSGGTLGIFMGLCVQPACGAGTVHDYQAVYDTQYETNEPLFTAMAASNNGETYYTFQYVFGGTLSLYEATKADPKNVKYLERALGWAETMVATATIVDAHGDRNWRGEWASPYSSSPISLELTDLQGATELARLARIVLTDPALKAVYGVRARAIHDFVKTHIVDKWLYSRRSEQWFLSNSTIADAPYNDKCALLARILTDLFRMGDVSYLPLLTKMADGLKDRLTPYGTGGPLIWDLHNGANSSKGHSEDTSHASRWPWMMIDCMNAGVSISSSEVKGIADLLTDVIWDRSSSASPRFSNYIDGNNDPYEKRPAWGNGLVYDGWVTLAKYDAKTMTIMDATLKAILAGKHNPSLDYNGTSFGIISLSGHLAKAAAALPRITGLASELSSTSEGSIIAPISRSTDKAVSSEIEYPTTAEYGSLLDSQTDGTADHSTVLR